MKTKDQSLAQVAEAKANYYSQCFEYAKRYAKRQTSRFTAEECISKYKASKNPQPANNSVWGAVFNTLRKGGLIKHVGYTRATNPSAHQRPICLWVLND